MRPPEGDGVRLREGSRHPLRQTQAASHSPLPTRPKTTTDSDRQTDAMGGTRSRVGGTHALHGATDFGSTWEMSGWRKYRARVKSMKRLDRYRSSPARGWVRPRVKSTMRLERYRLSPARGRFRRFRRWMGEGGCVGRLGLAWSDVGGWFMAEGGLRAFGGDR